jgi:hypothetical protein
VIEVLAMLGDPAVGMANPAAARLIGPYRPGGFGFLRVKGWIVRTIAGGAGVKSRARKVLLF